ncbi:MAG: hypothetical protein KIT84_15285 [Labilithrix sp.]|nr:hypothetical protein [Labilithrix sp.]MCW5812388.1 hypothetical protein [Labilithrix sp.]
MVQGVFAVLVTLVALVATPDALVGKIVLFAAAAAPLLLALRSRSRATKARAAATESGERAWLAAAEELAHGGTTAKKVAKELAIDPARAERLLTDGAARSRVRIDVEAGGDDIVYRTEDLSSDEYPALDEREGAGEVRRSRA